MNVARTKACDIIIILIRVRGYLRQRQFTSQQLVDLMSLKTQGRHHRSVYDIPKYMSRYIPLETIVSR